VNSDLNFYQVCSKSDLKKRFTSYWIYARFNGYDKLIKTMHK